MQHVHLSRNSIVGRAVFKKNCGHCPLMHLMTSLLTYLSRLFTRGKKIEKKNIVSERKEIKAVCVLTPRLFS